jgi:hypothetical protein
MPFAEDRKAVPTPVAGVGPPACVSWDKRTALLALQGIGLSVRLPFTVATVVEGEINTLDEAIRVLGRQRRQRRP